MHTEPLHMSCINSDNYHGLPGAFLDYLDGWPQFLNSGTYYEVIKSPGPLPCLGEKARGAFEVGCCCY